MQNKALLRRVDDFLHEAVLRQHSDDLLSDVRTQVTDLVTRDNVVINVILIMSLHFSKYINSPDGMQSLVPYYNILCRSNDGRYLNTELLCSVYLLTVRLAFNNRIA